MQLDKDTAEALVRLSHTRDFELFIKWLDKLNGALVADAIHGAHENYTPDVLRGRAQALAIIKQEIDKAPSLVSRIQKIS